MEKRKSSLSSIKACRFCLAHDGLLSSLYDRTNVPKNSSLNLHLQIMSCVSIEVFPSDRMPSQICDRCKYFMDIFYRFKQIVRQADQTIMQFVQNGDALEPVVWHNKLTKVYRSANQPQAKRQDKNALVKANSTEEYDSDEDNENTYNIKIGDGPDDESKESTCIKVVKTGDRLHITKDDPKGKKETLSRSPRTVTSPPERPYQCKYCDKTFLMQHHYVRHVRGKHKNILSPPALFGVHSYSCEQCDDTFDTQDELIYHSAKHAAENLTCPLCHEKFQQVEEVSAHIKTHDGDEYMCDLCELVFTSKEKLDKHLIEKHDDEINQEEHDLGLDDESMEMDDEDADDNINVKDAGDHMVVEIKKSSGYIKSVEVEVKNEHSEGSETEATYTELATVDTIALAKQAAAPPKAVAKAPVVKRQEKPAERPDQAVIIPKAEDPKRKFSRPIEITSNVTVVKAATKPESTSTSTAGASDKSLRLLEKELQELQRTNNPSESAKSSAKTADASSRGRGRPPMHASTPKPNPRAEEKKLVTKATPTMDKKQPERRAVTKENKEPKEKEPKANNNKEDKESKEQKEAQAKSIVKNGPGGDKAALDDSVRRSSRPSKVKDYAKMVREKAGSDDDSDSDYDEEYEVEKVPEKRGRKPGVKLTPKQAPASADSPGESGKAKRKRGRPRKDALKEVPVKVKKTNEEEEEEDEFDEANTSTSKTVTEVKTIKDKPAEEVKDDIKEERKSIDTNETSPTKAPENQADVMVSPSGQTLKKVPIKALPPGIKPMPLPKTAVRNVGVCEMQIGKKVVKVQKIVMTKAEVEAMKNQGLVEMKDGTMVLKQGIKLPTSTSDASSLRTSLVGNDTSKESAKKDKATPTRFIEDS